MKALIAKILQGNKLKDNKGQTAVEYILLIVVMVTIIMSLGAKIRSFMLTKDCSSSNPSGFFCTFKNWIPETSAQLKYFRLIYGKRKN